MDEHPELYAEQYFDRLRKATQRLPETKAIGSLLGQLEDRIAAWLNQQAQFSIGYAPYELLWSQVTDGVVGLAAAERTAAAAFRPAESQSYVRAITSLTKKLNPEAALTLIRIVRAATAARPGGALADEAGRYAEVLFLGCAARVLAEHADGRLFSMALMAGEAVLVEARRTNDVELEISALLGLGALCTNPYTGRRTSLDLERELYRWQRQFWETHRQELEGLDPETWQMPPVSETLPRGADYYRRAAGLLQGHERGMSLKAAVQSLLIAETTGVPVDRASLSQWGHEAAGLIDPVLAPGEVVAILHHLVAMGEDIDLSVVDALLEPSLDQRLRRHGQEMAVDVALNIVSLLRRVAPQRALEAADRARPLIDLLDLGWARRRQWSNEVQALVSARVPGGYDSLSDAEPAVVRETVKARAAAEDWDPLSHAAALVGLAGMSPHTDDEAFGLAMLDEAEELAPVWCHDHAQALDHLRATLHLGIAVNAVQDEDWAAAIQSYATSLSMMCDLGLSDAALDVLARIDDLVARTDHEGAINTVIGIAACAIRLENLNGDAATWYLQNICKNAIATLMAGAPGTRINPEALIVVLQLAKGLRFAGLLLSRDRFRWQEDDQGRRLLDRLDEAESELAARGNPVDELPDQPVDEHMLLAAYSTAAPDNLTDTPRNRVRALRHAYDSHLTRRLLADSRTEDLVLLASDGIQRALDDRTVLIDVYIGVSPQRTLAIYTVALTRTGMRAAAALSDFPDAELQFGDDDASARGSIVSLLVSELRRNLMEPSDPDDVSAETQEELDTLLSDYLPGVAACLDTWRAEGKDHLCFVPHGPLHYVPFGLMRHRGRPLCEDWTVTTLPNHALLLDERGGATTTTRRERQLTTFALTYPEGNPHAMSPLPHTSSEARAIGDVFGVAPLLDDDATETRFVEALQTSRFVHLAAHGSHDFHAPSFQCVYLTPDEASDGLLRAHELTSLDLRGTEMVTLSACETSLGRMDLADNAWGLPATLLLAGVRTIVGTLWGVRSDTAEFFYRELYERVRSGIPRHYAYAAALRSTREQYPVYRDWGAFSFIGGWD
ncbi:CHAT domain-containing protein [Streptomyces sp. NPDC050564]|uniref:CHAT domain-containing protein n=1 Tax=Streptomyces sp. NPDC050564 TaxID=3365631 RepID=UPI0037A3F82B